MALFEELEPPSQRDKAESNKKLNTSSKSSFVLKKSKDIIKLTSEKVLAPLAKTDEVKKVLVNFFESTKQFIKTSRYLPHVAMLLLGLIVAGTNLSQKITAKAFSSEIVTVTPDSEYSISKEVDKYTPMIRDDSAAVEQYLLAMSSSDGFISNTGSVSTEITQPAALAEAPSGATLDNSEQTVEYVILTGDTLTSIGWKYEVKLATLKYINNIDNENMIKPGAKIKIPKKGYEISASLIAKRENEKKAKLAAASRNTTVRNSSRDGRITVKTAPGSRSNAYPYGYCTYYVATRRAVPAQWGDAKNWLNSASRSGYSTGSTPVAGSIVVTRESWWGHVAYVESVSGNQITISEMNAKGWGVTSRRTLSANDGVIRGYIY